MVRQHANFAPSKFEIVCPTKGIERQREKTHETGELGRSLEHPVQSTVNRIYPYWIIAAFRFSHLACDSSRLC